MIYSYVGTFKYDIMCIRQINTYLILLQYFIVWQQLSFLFSKNLGQFIIYYFFSCSSKTKTRTPHFAEIDKSEQKIYMITYFLVWLMLFEFCDVARSPIGS